MWVRRPIEGKGQNTAEQLLQCGSRLVTILLAGVIPWVLGTPQAVDAAARMPAAAVGGVVELLV